MSIGAMRAAIGEAARRVVKDIAKLRPVFASLRKGFSLIVAPHGTGTTVTFDLPANIGMVVFVLVVVFFVGIGFVGVTYTKLAILALQATKLRAENELLRVENTKITEIQAEIARIESLRRQIETWAGVAGDRRADAGSEDAAIPVTNHWPRQYTYSIMKPFYEGFAPPAEGLLVPADGWISRGFTLEAGSEAGHPGIDIVVPKGTPVRCALDGVVKSAGWDETYGNLVVVEHSDSIQTAYGHNDRVLVKEGDNVTQGQIIAVAGSTGKSTAPHVHFSIAKNNRPVDPEKYLDLTRR